MTLKETLVLMTKVHWQTNIDMNKKVLIPIVVAVMILPGMYFGGIIPMNIVSHGYSPTYSDQELVERSEIVAKGILVTSESYIDWYVNDSIAVPSVFTVWSLQQSESIKGEKSNIIKFVVDGGTFNNITQKSMDYTELNEGDKVIVFLSKDTDSVYKGNYYMTGIETGIYKIENGMATNSYKNTSIAENSFKSSLKSFN